LNLKTTRAQTGSYSVSPLLSTNNLRTYNAPNRGAALREAFGVSGPTGNTSTPSSNGNSSSSSNGSSAPVRRF